MSLLYIPWFRAEPWNIPLPFDFPILGDELALQPFGVLVASGVLLGMYVAEGFARRRGIAPSVVSDLVAHVVIGGFLGAYLLNGVFYETDRLLEVIENPELLLRTWLGLSSYGGFLGATLGGLWWSWRRRLSLLAVGDAAAFALPFGWMLGRTGCFVVHDHPGRVTDFFLAVDNYRVGMPPFEPRHDLGLYEVIWSVLAVLVLLALMQRKWPRGFYVAIVPMMYAPIRFFLDFLRARPEQGGDVRFAGLTPAQYASITFFLIGGAILWRIYKKGEPSIPEYAQWPPREGSQSEDKGSKSGGERKEPHAAASSGGPESGPAARSE